MAQGRGCTITAKQATFHHFSKCHLADLAKIERDLIKENSKIIQIVAKRLGDS
jgi:hypothetical protein